MRRWIRLNTTGRVHAIDVYPHLFGRFITRCSLVLSPGKITVMDVEPTKQERCKVCDNGE